MPIAKLKCVREVSSECPNFKAINLLEQQPGNKWKARNAGEKSVYVIFELERPVQITGIDIGNEHSAFVEVLVSSGGCRPEDFTEILITCSFMTPNESKSSSNANRVRCFSKDALVTTATSEKWSLIKVRQMKKLLKGNVEKFLHEVLERGIIMAQVICTQPFNKHIQYGLSFIKFYIVEEEVPKKDIVTKAIVPTKFLTQKQNPESEKIPSQKTKIIAKFALREESPDSDSESSAALFSRWKKHRESENMPTTAAVIRQASLVSNLRKSTEGLKKMEPIAHNSGVNENQSSEIRDRNRIDLSFGPEEEVTVNENKKLERLSKHIAAEQVKLQAQIQLKKKEENKIKKSEKSSEQLNNKHIETMHKEKQSSKISVNLCSSGKRVSSASGGPSKKLKPDTTPKYRPFSQLLQGVVLVISGIQNPDRANLREKALAMGAKYTADWEKGCTHLICAFKNTPKYNQVKGKGKIVKRIWIEKCFDLKKYLPWRRYALDSDEEAKPESDNEICDETYKSVNKDDVVGGNIRYNGSIEDTSSVLDSGSDTDDDIERIMQKNKENEVSSKKGDVYDIATEEEEYIQEKTKNPKESLSFFYKTKFFIDYNNFSERMNNQLVRCIKRYGGYITQKTREADFIIAENVPEICQSEIFSGTVVRPQWIFECNDMERKLSLDSFIVYERK